MRILILGYPDTAIHKELGRLGEEVLSREAKVDLPELKKLNPDFIISYGYRFLISEEIINFFKNRIINLHISLLPWNKGAHPNFWSIFDGTPSGVTIHLVDQGLDTGAILLQQSVDLNWGSDTLKTSYQKLITSIENLLIANWEQLRCSAIPAKPQKQLGSSHKKNDIDRYFAQLPLGWDTPIAVVRSLGNKI